MSRKLPAVRIDGQVAVVEGQTNGRGRVCGSCGTRVKVYLITQGRVSQETCIDCLKLDQRVTVK